jgi:hypothetical protein
VFLLKSDCLTAVLCAIGSLVAKFSIRKFIVEERDHQPVAL